MSLRQQTRRKNLEAMISEYDGSAAELARNAGTSPSYLSQLRHGSSSSTGQNRGVGDDLAARLERAAGKPGGWLDRQGESDSWSGVHCPLKSWREFSDIHQDAQELAKITCPVACGPETFALRIEAMPSMEPTFRDGDLVFIDPGLRASNGAYVVVRHKSGKNLLRQVVVEDESRYWRADNPNWPSQFVKALASDKVLGGVVFRGTVM